MNGVCLPAQSEGGKAPHHASVYDDILKTARETWQNALGNCNGCGLCASRCELFGDGIASMSDIVGSGMVLLDAIEELFAESGFDDRTISDTIHTHTEKYDKLYSLTRRCCLCNNCTARCPGAVRADRVMRPWRALYQRSGLFGTVNNDLKSVEVDKEWHLFSVYRHLNGVFYPEFIHLDDAGPGQVDTLFFPGCTMVTYMDDSVRATGKLLDDRGYRWAIDLGCCGSPLVGRGLPERVETLQRKLLDRCHAAGIKRIITVCAGCEMELVEAVGKHGVGAPEVISLPQLLVDLGVDLPESPQDVAFFDSCHDRSQSHGSPLRRMFAGCSICKLEHEGQDTLCCGAGGAVSSFDAEIGGIRAGRILEEAVAAGAKILISSCPTCAYTFAFQKIYGNPPSESAGIECRHYLELLFGIETDWSQVFARAEWMWTGEHSAWVLSELT
ncbi:MAG TPA: hypothetical protein DEB24_02940 [Coriobacteriia bacterium]|nr:hypothetical protein [Coriobacteriia bacterium]